MKLPNGHYITANGSEMWISGEHSGVSKVDWDRLAEGACWECQIDPYEDDGQMHWYCEDCGGGRADLIPVTDNA